jgi:hypothetical protein
MAAAAAAGALAAFGAGCGERQTGPRPRLWTLFELEAAAEAGKAVAAGGTFGPGIPASYFISPRSDGEPGNEVTLNAGYIEGRKAVYATTEMWSHFDEVWVQPLYRAINDDGTPVMGAPWVFGVGPGSLFYSPFWEVFGFRPPPGVDVGSILSAAAAVDAANRTGGFVRGRPRITSLAPATVAQSHSSLNLGEQHYAKDNAAWGGVGGRRYIDFGPGRFTFGPDGVVKEIPIFMFVTLDPATGGYDVVPGAVNVGGIRPLFSAPAVTSSPPAPPDGGAVEPPVEVDQASFGGLWRLHLAVLPAGSFAVQPDGRVSNGRVLDSQAAIEALGPTQIQRTEILAACPLIQLGDAGFFFPEGAL